MRLPLLLYSSDGRLFDLSWTLVVWPSRYCRFDIFLIGASDGQIALRKNVEFSNKILQLFLLRRPGDSSFALRLVVVPTGRIARQLFVGLYVAELLQSTLLRLPARFRIHCAGHRFNFLLLRHLPVHHAICQGHNAIDLDQRWQSAF